MSKATMKAAVYYAPGDIRYEDMPYPHCTPDGVVLKVGSCGVCTVMDVDAWIKWSMGGQGVGLARGHEWSGEIVEVGKNVKDFKVGQKVFQNPVFRPCFRCNYCFEKDYWRCINWRDGMAHRAINGGFAEYISIPFVTIESMAILPDDLGWNDLALIEPTYLGVGLATKAKDGEVAFVNGLELMGLATIAKMKERDVKVIAAGYTPRLLKAAENAGADVVINSMEQDVNKVIMKTTHGRGADLAFVIDTRPTALFECMSSVRRSGNVWLTGYYYSPFRVNPKFGPNSGEMTTWIGPGAGHTEPTVGFDPNLFHMQIAWGTLGPRVPRWYEAAKLIKSGKICAKNHITSVFPLSKTSEAFDLAAKSDDEIKVMVEIAK